MVETMNPFMVARSILPVWPLLSHREMSSGDRTPVRWVHAPTMNPFMTDAEATSALPQF
jgi:hypothetical protein